MGQAPQVAHLPIQFLFGPAVDLVSGGEIILRQCPVCGSPWSYPLIRTVSYMSLDDDDTANGSIKFNYIIYLRCPAGSHFARRAEHLPELNCMQQIQAFRQR